MEVFAQALLIGLAVAAPVGPMALIVIERTLDRGQAAGLAFGLGVAAADASYAALAALGVSALRDMLLAASRSLTLAGALLMLYFGLRIALAKPATQPGTAAANSNAKAFVAAFGLTLANPPTIIFFAGVFATLGNGGAVTMPLTFAGGVLAGSALWWLALTAALRALGRFLDVRWRRAINIACGAAIATFALSRLLGG